MEESLSVNNESGAEDLNLEQNTIEDQQLINTNEEPCDNQVVTTSCWDSIEDNLDELVVFDTPSKQIGADNNSVQQPAVGMVFQSFRDIDTYLRAYGKQSGFVVVSGGQSYRKSGGRKTNVLRNSTWRCENAGYNVKRVSIRKLASMKNGNEANNEEVEDGLGDVRKSKKCGCPVMFYASATRNDEWHLKKAILVHENHSPSPSRTRYISVFRQAEITPSVRRRLSNDLDAGLTVAQIHRGLVRDRNGIENIAFTQRDIRNLVAKDKKKKVRFGDSNAMYSFLKRMSDDNELFFHNHRLDEHGTLKDVMWVDARSRVAYEEFSDVVCFDSTYITNKYDLPFANFVGVNHHGQTILLGCALLSKENTETFEWFFQTWLTCMGKAPGGILTDQDPTMRKALARVMPDSKHRWCIWHILTKFSKKLGWNENYSDLKEELHNVIYESLTSEEFETRWSSVLKKYKLEEDDWLRGLFEEREMWVPTYLKHLFWAGMKTTQRCESINSFFDGYVNGNTHLYEFVQQYIAAMEVRVESENQADADSLRYTQQSVTRFSFEKTFQKLYTYAKFCDFQNECRKLLYVRMVDKKAVLDDVVDVTVGDRVWVICKPSRKEIATRHKRKYTVTFNTVTHEASCPCMMFESHGILCRHIICIYDMYDVEVVPDQYILRRWRKDVVRQHTKVKVAYHDPSKTESVRRYDKIMLAFEPVCLEAAQCEEEAKIALKAVESLKNTLAQRRGEMETATPRVDPIHSKEGDNINPTLSSQATPSSKGVGSRCGGSTPCSVRQTTESPGDQCTPPANNCARILSTSEIPTETPEDTLGLALEQSEGPANTTTTATDCATATDLPFPDIKDPPVKRGRGRPRGKRFLSCIEQPQTKKSQKKTSTKSPS